MVSAYGSDLPLGVASEDLARGFGGVISMHRNTCLQRPTNATQGTIGALSRALPNEPHESSKEEGSILELFGNIRRAAFSDTYGALINADP